MTPNGGKPPLLLETEMKNAEGVFGSRRRRPEAGGGGVGGAKTGSRLEGVLATTLRRFLRSDIGGARGRRRRLQSASGQGASLAAGDRPRSGKKRWQTIQF